MEEKKINHDSKIIANEICNRSLAFSVIFKTLENSWPLRSNLRTFRPNIETEICTKPKKHLWISKPAEPSGFRFSISIT